MRFPVETMIDGTRCQGDRVTVDSLARTTWREAEITL